MKRWNPAACSTTLSPHVPTPRTFTLSRWEIERGSCILASLGTGTKVAGPYCWHPCGEAAPREQPPERPGSLRGGVGAVLVGNALPLLLLLVLRPASHDFFQYFAHHLSSSPERPRRWDKNPQASPGELSPWNGGPSVPAPPCPPFPSSGRQPGRPRRGSQQSSGFCCICWRRAAGGDRNKGTVTKPG